MRFLLSGLALGWLLGAQVVGGAEWKAGLAKVVITPPKPVFMAGYASRDRPSQGVVHHLYAKALALTDRNGKRAVIVTTDLIGFRAAVAEPICERIMEETGLQRSEILLSSSHTHTGPSQTTEMKATGNMGEDEARQLFDYTQWLQDRVVRVVAESLKKSTPVKLSQGVGVAGFVMNRREPTARGIVLGFNPRGPVDRSVPVLRVETEAGKLLAVLFQAAAHNTTLSGRHYDICGDYAGFAQAHVERARPGVQAMFMLGCAGDANPHPRGTLDAARQNGEQLGAEVLRLLDDKLTPVNGPLQTVYDHVDVPLQPLLAEKELETFIRQRGGWRRWVAGKMLELHARGESGAKAYPAPFSVWQFGNDLTLVGLSGEVVVDYVYRLEGSLGPLNLWIAAYCHDVYGYLPSARILREGGYETRGIYSGGIGFFAPAAEDVVVRKLTDLARQAGRKLP